MPTPRLSAQLRTKNSRLPKRILLLFSSVLVGLLAALGLLLQSASLSQAAAGPAQSSLAAAMTALQPFTQITPATTITSLDIVVVFDISGSGESQTVCHDCWVRTSYNPDFPNNGYFNPLPYNPTWAITDTDNQSIPDSSLCTIYPPRPFINSTFQYLTVEAELYSANESNWDLAARQPGQGFWAIQRGSRNDLIPTGNTAEWSASQGNQAGNPANQSSNVCRPNAGGIDCTVGAPGSAGDNVCASADGGLAVDCSTYLSARPYQTYDQAPGYNPYLNGAAYNLDCFLSGPGPFSDPPYSNHCWSNERTPGSNPFYATTGPGPGSVPWVEYDFTPTWDGLTYIWLRAIGGNARSYAWAGPRPDTLDTTPGNNLVSWPRVIYWQVDNGVISESNDSNLNIHSDWRDNRANNSGWRWLKLGSVSTISGSQSILKLYQGSSGFKVDKLIFTNDATGTTGQPPTAMRLRDDGVTVSSSDNETAVGPPASEGSASREACNRCNPAYGYTVDPTQCSCKLSSDDNANDGYGSGQGCTRVLSLTNQLENDLYSGLQPLRDTQEAIKNFARKLNPQCHQLGLVPFMTGAVTNDATTRRSKLQCLNWATQHAPGGATACYDTNLFPSPISYTQVISAVEKQWSDGGTNFAEGLREGLEELGISTPGNPATSNCTLTANDGQACDRGGMAGRMLILVTDGSPNVFPSNCASLSGYTDLWDGDLGSESAAFECAMYYASLAAQNDVTLHIIGLGPGADFNFLTALATGVNPRGSGNQDDEEIFTGAGGQYFAATQPSDLDTAFDQIFGQAPRCPAAGPALTLTQSSTPEAVAAGDVLTYTLTAINDGSADATGVVMTDTLDRKVSFAWASHGGRHEGDSITWEVGTIPLGQTITRTLGVTIGLVPNGAILTNTVRVTSVEGISDTRIATVTVKNSSTPSNQPVYLPLILK